MPTEAATKAFLEALSGDDERDLYNRAPCGFVSTLPDGTIVKANQTFLTWIGESREDLVGKRRFSDLLNAGGRIYYETHYAPTLQMQGHVNEVALDFVRRDGSRLPALVNSVLHLASNGEPVVRTVVFDATERRRYERELLQAKARAEASERALRQLADTLQQTLLPPTVPQVDGLEIAAAYRPAGEGHEVGGDFYDVFPVEDDEWMVVVGDVCGKGVHAAIVTSAARYAIRTASMAHHDLGEVLRVVNDVLRGHESQRFCTLGVARLCRQGDNWTAQIASAGHPPTILRSPSGETSEVDATGTISGVLAEPVYRCSEIDLTPGSTLVLYTDGVTEGRRDGQFYGETPFMDLIAGHDDSAESQVAALLSEVVTFQRGRTRDDIVIVAIRVPVWSP